MNKNKKYNKSELTVNGIITILLILFLGFIIFFSLVSIFKLLEININNNPLMAVMGLIVFILFVSSAIKTFFVINRSKKQLKSDKQMNN